LRQQQPQHPRDRRASMFSQHTGQIPYRGHAPLPHEDQAHFYPNGLPDLDSIGVPASAPTSGLRPGENGYFCGWDSLSTSGHGPSATADNVLLVGFEGGLRVYRVSRKSSDPIGKLENLRGSVIGAKILPWTCRKDPGSAGRPHVALIIHGPMLSDPPEIHNSSDESAPVSAEESSPEPSVHPSSRPSSAKEFEIRETLKQYQTTVEVYSLLTQKRVAVLYSSRPVEDDCDPLGEYKKPPPVGDLKVDANGKFVVVASGVSGEVFIFSPYSRIKGTKELESIRCVGKLWTTVKPRGAKKAVNANGNLDASSSSDDSEVQHGIPLFSLSNRWIATVPPVTPVHTFEGTAHVLDPSARPPGLATKIAPIPPPPTTCAVDIPDGSEFMNRMSREVTQHAIKGAKYIGEQGYRVWSNYWNPSTSMNNMGYAQQLPPAQHFPPTHDYSNAAPTANNDPTQVAIFDLQRFLVNEEWKLKNVLQPLATFELPSGCSFLSFAPSGLHMITVSKKGDEQFIWSLMKMRDPRSAIPGAPSSTSGPYVRQIKKFARLTKATTIDVVWSAPHGERFAILTDRGTVHAHEIPASVFQWPPVRRARRVKKAQKTHNDRPVSPQGRLSSAVNAINGASTWIKTARTKGLGQTVGFGGLGITPANMSSKALKAGFRQSLGAVATGAQAVYHAADNKLHLTDIIPEATPSCMRWMTGRDKGSLAIVAAGSVYIYSAKQTSTSRKGQPPVLGAKISKKPTVFNLHNIPDDQFAPALIKAVEARASGTVLDAAALEPTGGWHLRAPTALTTKKKQHKRRENWHALVEAETNPPYQPFHTDRRVSLYAYAEPDTPPPRIPDKDSSAEEFAEHDSARQAYTNDILSPHLKAVHHVDDDAAWLYGMEITNTRVIREGGGGGSGDDDGDDFDRVVRENEDGELVVGTTVRRRGREEEEFFEDDCEVIDFAEDRV
jgi:hypothetical protein